MQHTTLIKVNDKQGFNWLQVRSWNMDDKGELRICIGGSNRLRLQGEEAQRVLAYLNELADSAHPEDGAAPAPATSSASEERPSIFG